MTNDTRQAFAILAFILLGPMMLLVSVQEVVVTRYEVREEEEEHT